MEEHLTYYIFYNNQYLYYSLLLKKEELSGGEQQRIAICRSLYKGGDFLILDEPTNGLDIKGKELLIKYLKNIKDKIILIITHDDSFNKLTDNIISL